MNQPFSLRVKRAAGLASEDAAVDVVRGLVEAMRRHLDGLLVYGRTQTGVLHLRKENVSEWLDGSRTPDFGAPTPYTHRSVLVDAPRKGAHVGGLSLRVGPREESAHGVVFVLRIDEARAARVDAKALVQACSKLDVDQASCGAISWARGETAVTIGASTAATASRASAAARPPSAEELLRLIDEVSLSIDEYARIRATIAVLPAQEDAIWCIFGVFDARSRRHFEAAMDLRFAREPGAHAMFRASVASWLRITLTSAHG